MPDESIHDIVRKVEKSYQAGGTVISKYVSFDMLETLEKIDAYLNSVHVSGKEDSLGREKPFFNIVTAAVNIWYRATDIDRKDIRIKANNAANTVPALLASVHLQNWMKKARFGQFLNEWGRTLARYGSAVSKFVVKDGELVATVIPWNRIICDMVDFNAQPRIEKLYLTPSQLRQNPLYNQDVVEQLINSRQARTTLDGTNRDNVSDFIELYEVHGELSMATYKQAKGIKRITKADRQTYRQQMHVISYVIENDGEIRDYSLFVGKEKKDPYIISHLLKEDGRTMGIGAVEYLFQAQWMQNHTIKQMKDHLDLASKLIFQTSDVGFVGRNALTSIENGDVLIHNTGEPLTQINNGSHDITSLKLFADQWRVMANELVATPDSMKGTQPPSGTAYRLQEIITNESHSLFEIMTENKGLAIEDMLREHVIPYIKTKLDTKEEIMATLDAQGIAEIDSIYVPIQAAKNFNDRTKPMLLNELTNPNTEIPQPFNKQQEESVVQESLQKMGNKRSFTPDEIGLITWKEFFKDLEWEVDVEVTNESTDKQAVLTTLSTALQTIASNPAVLQDPNAKMLFSAILTETGRISPLQIAHTAPSPSPAPVTNNVVGGAGNQLEALTN